MMADFIIVSETQGADPQEVEGGLSPGELRQALLDYLTEEIDLGHITVVNNCLEPYDLRLSRRALLTTEGHSQALTDLEELLYTLEDGDLVDTVWPLTEETLTVEEAQE